MAGWIVSVRNAGTARWWAVGWISVTQLMMVVDGTVMNVAVPSMQADLGMSDVQRQWVITIYVLVFGSMLLLGGRLSDLIGRRNALLIGLAGFMVASILGGISVSGEMLIAMRAVQGLFGALVTPSALALLSMTFPEGEDRARAFGVFGTIMGSGSGIGVLLGGVVTDSWGWRWALLINAPIAIAAAVGVLLSLQPDARRSGSVDVMGGVLSIAGLAALAFGLTNAETAGWGSVSTIGLLVGGVLMLAGFVSWQRRTSTPLLPLSLFAERLRTAAFASMLAWGVAILPTFLFLSVYLQQIAGFSPLLTGLAFLPYTAAILITVRLVRPALTTLTSRAFLGIGLALLAVALVVLSLLRPDAPYWSHVLPVFVLLGLGTGCVQPAANSMATYRAGSVSGVAGATASSAQQVGSSLGLALLGTVAAATTADVLAAAPGIDADAAIIHGYGTAGLVGAAILASAAIVVPMLAGAQEQSRPAKRPGGAAEGASERVDEGAGRGESAG